MLVSKVVIRLVIIPVEVRELLAGGDRHPDALLRLVSPVNEEKYSYINICLT